jgi:hypothetical protein
MVNSFNNLVLGIAALTMTPMKSYDQNIMCNVIFTSYMTGCVDVYKADKLNDLQIDKIVAECLAKSKSFTLAINDCKTVQFE